MARLSRSSAVLPRIGLALVFSMLAGLVLAGLALPVVAGVGLTAQNATDDFLALPSELQTPPLAERSRVLAADGSLLATFFSVNRVATRFEDVPVQTRQAVVAIEDSRFYTHSGVDYKGTLRAAITNARTGRVEEGGSTLTQQYVKNALIQSATDKAGQQAAQATSADRKLREARYALALERRLSKDEILHRYMEIAYYGNSVYGIGTAALSYFNKPVSQLTLGESALLVGVVQNPSRFDVDSPAPEVRADLVNRRNTVLGRMRDVGSIDEAARAAAAAEPLPVVTPTSVLSGCEAASTAPFFCDHVKNELENSPVGAALGPDLETRQAALFGGGLTIQTTLDPAIQAAAQAAVDKGVPAGDLSGAVAVANVVEPGTGHVKAMAVDRGFGDAPGQTKVNLATGGGAGYQGGSTFKPFVLAAALQKGLPLSLSIKSPPKYLSPIFKNCDGNSCKPYEVNNAEASEGGTFDMRTAMAASVNTYYIQLAERTGLETPSAVAESLGVRWKKAGQELPLARNASTMLGAQEVSPLAMAGAYAAFAAHGLFCPPQVVLAITGRDGLPVPVPPVACGQALDQGIADTVTDVLTSVVTSGTGRGAALDRPVAAKTGTTNESRAAWLVGYTPQLATAVWVGLPDPVSGAPQPMKRVTINDQYYRQMYGGNLPADIWQDAMSAALAGAPVLRFERPDPTVARGARGEVPDVTGQSYDDATRTLLEAGFEPQRGRRVPGGSVGEGLIVYTSPRAGRAAAAGSQVYLYVSSGRSRATTAPRPTRPARTTRVPTPFRRPATLPAALPSTQPPALPSTEPAALPSTEPPAPPSVEPSTPQLPPPA